MSAQDFVKLYRDLLGSTVWIGNTPSTRCVWIALLLLADRKGEVRDSLPGLAHAACVSVEEARAAIAEFQAPDPDSRTPTANGARLVPLDGGHGWRLVNYLAHRERRSEGQEKAAARQARFRASRSVTGRDSALRNVTSRDVTQEDADNASPGVMSQRVRAELDLDLDLEQAKATSKAESKSIVRRASRNGRQTDDDPPGFAAFWDVYPRKEAKKSARKAWNAKGCEAMAQRIVADVRERMRANWLDKEPEFIPHPATYINGARWDDAIVYPAPPKPDTGRIGAAMDRLRTRMARHDAGLQSVGVVIEAATDDWGTPP